MCVKFGTVETENITLTIDRNFFDKLEIEFSYPGFLPCPIEDFF